MGVAANLARINEELAGKQVRLIAVTKKAEPSQMEEAFGLGVTEFGENRIQDALAKREKLSPSLVQNAKWHFIGHLQTNKVKQAVGNFSLIHSVDSLKLAREISRVASSRGMTQAILLQVKLVEDPDKSGFSRKEILSQFEEISKLPNLRVEGLMTITPLTEDPSITKQCFTGLRQLRSELEAGHGVALKELSMGMTNDWQEAVDCGATMIRLGRAIFYDSCA
ncbi:YggS family pyridoxal phosphate-dependent enzyme [bacterium]|nr:YggS family pyridoxal phosphate-dependent enzyme [bacterium]